MTPPIASGGDSICVRAKIFPFLIPQKLPTRLVFVRLLINAASPCTLSPLFRCRSLRRWGNGTRGRRVSFRVLNEVSTFRFDVEDDDESERYDDREWRWSKVRQILLSFWHFQRVRLSYVKSVIILLILRTIMFIQFCVCAYKAVASSIFFVRRFEFIRWLIDPIASFLLPVYLLRARAKSEHQESAGSELSLRQQVPLSAGLCDLGALRHVIRQRHRNLNRRQNHHIRMHARRCRLQHLHPHSSVEHHEHNSRAANKVLRGHEPTRRIHADEAASDPLAKSLKVLLQEEVQKVLLQRRWNHGIAVWAASTWDSHQHRQALRRTGSALPRHSENSRHPNRRQLHEGTISAERFGKSLDSLDLLHKFITKTFQIFKAGSIGGCMYFIASGTVCVMTTNGKELCHLGDGEYFGEVAMVLKNNKVSNKIVWVIAQRMRNCFVPPALILCHGHRILRDLHSRLCEHQKISSDKWDNYAEAHRIVQHVDGTNTGSGRDVQEANAREVRLRIHRRPLQLNTGGDLITNSPFPLRNGHRQHLNISNTSRVVKGNEMMLRFD